MDSGQEIKQQLHQTIESLPPEGLSEIAGFLEFLRFKYQLERPRKVVTLGGLWKNLDFDVTDAEIRALRRQVTQSTAGKV